MFDIWCFLGLEMELMRRNVRCRKSSWSERPTWRKRSTECRATTDWTNWRCRHPSCRTEAFRPYPCPPSTPTRPSWPCPSPTPPIHSGPKEVLHHHLFHLFHPPIKVIWNQNYNRVAGSSIGFCNWSGFNNGRYRAESAGLGLPKPTFASLWDHSYGSATYHCWFQAIQSTRSFFQVAETYFWSHWSRERNGFGNHLGVRTLRFQVAETISFIIRMEMAGG